METKQAKPQATDAATWRKHQRQLAKQREATAYNADLFERGRAILKQSTTGPEAA